MYLCEENVTFTLKEILNELFHYIVFLPWLVNLTIQFWPLCHLYLSPDPSWYVITAISAYFLSNGIIIIFSSKTLPIKVAM